MWAYTRNPYTPKRDCIYFQTALLSSVSPAILSVLYLFCLRIPLASCIHEACLPLTLGKNHQCPYKNVSESFKEALNKCPKFQSGCPFKDQELWQVLLMFHSQHGDIKRLAEQCPAFKVLHRQVPYFQGKTQTACRMVALINMKLSPT